MPGLSFVYPELLGLFALLAGLTGGGELAAAADAFRPLPTPATSPQALGFPLLMLALTLLPLDILIRRISVRARK